MKDVITTRPKGSGYIKHAIATHFAQRLALSVFAWSSRLVQAEQYFEVKLNLSRQDDDGVTD
jgi:hypothetical protein